MGVVSRRFVDYLRLARFHTPAGALLLLWPTLWGLWVAASGFPGWRWLAIFVVGVFVMRAFGCAVNDIIDRRLDAVVERTKDRPLAAGRISLGEAFGVAVFFGMLALALWWQLPPAAKWWAFGGGVVAIFYPTAKRFLSLPQAVLGVAFGWGMLVAAAVYDALPTGQVWLFFAANFLWVIAYDTIYAMADREGDKAHGGVHSSALLFGSADIKVVAVLYAAAIFILSVAGIIFGYGASYQVALIAAMICVYKFWQKYKTRHPAACMAAFRANHWFGLFVFAGIVSGG